MAVKPVIFIALANERIDQPNYLRGLVKEKELIQEALEPAIVAGLCELVIESHSSIKTLIDTFQNQRFKDRIAIFHFAGHADDFQLMLESNEGETIVAHSEGLIPFLSKQASLKLIFLNACSTQLQSEALVEAGIPLLIGTSQTVSDKVALQLSGRFYKGLGQGMQIGQAWTEAEAEVKMETGATRAMDFSRKKEHTDQLPWRVYVRKGSEEVKNWSLPLAAGNPLFGLPDISRTQDLPDVPYRYLQRFEKAQSQIFFGRGTYIRDLYARALDRHRAPLLLLYGQSGVGKSSLLEAGLLPRLEQKSEVHYVRRNPEKGLIHALVDIFGLTESIEAETLKSAWVSREQETAQPVTIILDQVEESLISPFEKGELESFMQLLAGVFSIYAERPQGKLILAYRKEFHPEIEELCKTLEIAHENIFINKFKRRDIIEIIEGLTSSDALCQKYKLEIEFNLPEIIADDLLVDQDSSIAPILQILLTKMWEQSKEGEGHHFKIATYNKLQKEGILLDDFYKEQMQKLQEWKPEVGKSGLALDLLYYHTTELATASSRKLEDISRLYAHQKDILEEIIQKFTDLFLLSRPGKNTSVLAHDTLAPLIQQKQRNADHPGQRAFRILESKKMALENKDEGFIDEDDLALVEAGRNGMRKWDEVEEELVKRSQSRRDDLVRERMRTAWFKRIAVGLIAAAAVVIAIFGRNQYKSAQANALITHAVQLEEKDPTVALRLAEEALKIQPDNENAQQAFYDIFDSENFYSQKLTHLAPVAVVAYSPDGQRIMSGSADGSARIWNSKGEEQFVIHTQGRAVTCAAFSPDGQRVLLGGEGFDAVIWDMNGKQLNTLKGAKNLAALAVLSEGNTLISGDNNGQVKVWNMEGDLTQEFPLHKDKITSLQALTHSDLIMSTSLDSTIKLWRLGDPSLSQEIKLEFPVLDAIFLGNGDSLLCAAEDGRIRMLNQQGDLIREYTGHKGSVNQLSLAREDGSFISAGSDNTLRLWSLGGKEKSIFKGHTKPVNAVAYNSHMGSFLSASDDHYVKEWKLYPKAQNKITIGPQEGISYISIVSENRIITAGLEGLWIWDQSGLKNQALEVYEDTLVHAYYSTKNELILGVGEDSTVYMWDIEGNLKNKDKVNFPLMKAAISSDAKWIAAGTNSGEIRIWDGDMKLQQIVAGHESGVYALDFAPDASYLISSGVDGGTKIWDLSGKLLRSFKDWEAPVSALALSSDGKFMLTGNYKNEIKFWDSEGTLGSISRGHQPNKILEYGYWETVSDIKSLAFSPNATQLISGGVDKSARVWDLEGNNKWSVSSHTDDVIFVSFSPDASMVRSADKQGNILFSYIPETYLTSDYLPQLDAVQKDKFELEEANLEQYLVEDNKEKLREYALFFFEQSKGIAKKSERLELLEKAVRIYTKIFGLPISRDSDKIDAYAIWLSYAESSLYGGKTAQSIKYYEAAKSMNTEAKPSISEEVCALILAYLLENKLDEAFQTRQNYYDSTGRNPNSFLYFFRKSKAQLLQEAPALDTLSIYSFEQQIEALQPVEK